MKIDKIMMGLIFSTWPLICELMQLVQRDGCASTLRRVPNARCSIISGNIMGNNGFYLLLDFLHRITGCRL